MTAWEYHFVVFNMAHDAWRPEIVNGKKRANWKQGPTMHQYCNQLGDDGWEMVNMMMQQVGLTLGDKIRIAFKRPSLRI